MNPLFTEEEFKTATCKQLLPFKCPVCEKLFHKSKNLVLRFLKGTDPVRNKTGKHLFCSHSCTARSKNINSNMEVICKQCGESFFKRAAQIKKTKNNFCGHHCAAKWHNAHKTTGTRRSKLEKWIEQQLRWLYPTLPINCNKTDAINAELDLYFPTLHFAVELNGVFHYEPIYGGEKLGKIKTNDQRKMLACAEQSIELCVIDVSSISYFKPEKAQQYLNIITAIINHKLTS